MRVRLLWVPLLIVVVGAGLWWLSTTNDARLFALDGATGRVQWSAELPYGTRVVGSPAVQNGRVVVSTAGPDPLGTDDRWRLLVYDARTGRESWRHEPTQQRRPRIDAVNLALTRPYVTDAQVFVRVEGDEGVKLLAFDAATGGSAWSVDDFAYGHDSRHTDLVEHGDRVLVPTRLDDAGLQVQARRTADGAVLWSVSLDGANFPRNDLGPFLAANPETFYVSLANGIVALDATTGAERFRVQTEAAMSGGQIALMNGVLFHRSGLSTIDAYDAATGQHRWTYRSPFDERKGALRSFGVRDGLLAAYCACDTVRERRSGWLLAVDAATGEERWRAELDAYLDLYQDMPVVGAGVVISGRERGDDVVGRAMSDGAERWHFPRDRGQLTTTDGRLVYLTDRAPRWRHWLSRLGLTP